MDTPTFNLDPEPIFKNLSLVHQFIIETLSRSDTFAHTLLTLYFAHLENGLQTLPLSLIWESLDARTSHTCKEDLETSLKKLAFVGSETDHKPFTFTAHKDLIQTRFFKLKAHIEKLLIERLQLQTPKMNAKNLVASVVAHSKACEGLNLSHEQQHIIQSVLTQPFSILSGGPGSGKTTLILNIVRAFHYTSLNANSGTAPKITICAPTGKAIHRVNEIIQKAKEKSSQTTDLNDPVIPQIDALLDPKTCTLHQFFGMIPDSPPLDHYPDFLLPDILIIDECSMISMELLHSVFKFFPPHKTLILIGDPDQLPPVNESCVFKDIIHYTHSFCHTQHLQNPHIHIKETHRFSTDIGKFIQHIQNRDISSILNILQQGTNASVQFIPLSKTSPDIEYIKTLLNTYLADLKTVLQSKDVSDLKLYEYLCTYKKVLTPYNKGILGTESLNQLIHALFFPWSHSYCAGEPVMILKNDYTLHLKNGEQGVLVQDTAIPLAQDTATSFAQNPATPLQILFKTQDTFKKISIHQLKYFALSYAMTVHKAQGSEFSEVLIFIPDGESQNLTKEWLYTAITRAKHKVTLAGRIESIQHILSGEKL